MSFRHARLILFSQVYVPLRQKQLQNHFISTLPFYLRKIGRNKMIRTKYDIFNILLTFVISFPSFNRKEKNWTKKFRHFFLFPRIERVKPPKMEQEYNSIRSPTKNGLQSFPRRLCSRVLSREKEIFCLRAERAVSDLQGETGSKNFNRVAPMQIAGDLLRGIILRPKAGRTNFVQMTGSGPAGGGGGFSWGCLAPSVIIFHRRRTLHSLALIARWYFC